MSWIDRSGFQVPEPRVPVPFKPLGTVFSEGPWRVSQSQGRRIHVTDVVRA